MILIYIGVSLLMGHRIMFEGDDNITLFRESTYSLETIENKEINVIFGKGVIDLSQIDLDRNKNFDLEVNSIFGSTDIYISDDTPVKITGSSAFASVTMPDNGNIVFGEINYNSNNDENIRFIKIEANAVFGSIEIIKKD
ncbi:MAG: LiaF domain-containing protein [bacterium]